MRWITKFLVLCTVLFFCREVKAAEHHPMVHFGPTMQIKAAPRALTTSVGGFSTFKVGGEYTEIHTSAWINVGSSGGGAGGGTLHQVTDKILFGWELAGEYEAEENEELWFLGVAPVAEYAEENIAFFVKVPVGWEFSHHHNGVGWGFQVGVNIPINM